MYSSQHAAISIVASSVLVYALSPITVFGSVVPAVAVVACATALGVLIDLDHFLIARVKTGNWNAVRFCLSHPSAAVADQGRIFDRGDVGALSRLLSHLVLAGVLVPAVALASTGLAVVIGVVLYVHVVCDVAWDIRRFRREAVPSPDEDPHTLR
ncbi:hypothetical protein [Natrarchaeobius chitinivorans]|uniref:Uncharacterized protein n=1 Tax=Natrarchaeobius chitinivorans TaxID=1679083 RepID=A0A3N6N5B7_NATCH|nr:hypothetical protein [Natrarchaeobius chitinivorans]RQG93442.1 hypothetical protein EA473_15575 [Natrarchaeobius chitinivorans]